MNKPPPRKKSPPKVPTKVPPPKTTRTAKTFTAGAWTGQGEGEKIIVTAKSGMGKTTLASMAPTPVFIGVDDGGRKIRNPKTGEPLQFVEGIETFQDVHDALQQPGLFADYESVVIDTVTKLEQWTLPYMFRTIPGPKGSVVTNITGYGYNKGYRHMYDTMALILQAADRLVKAGKNIILITQSIPAKIANPGGDDFLADVPELYNGTPSIMAQYVSWADHVLRIGYESVNVEERKATATAERAIFVHPEVHFVAKSRTIPIDIPVISFSSPDDDSIWRYLFDD